MVLKDFIDQKRDEKDVQRVWFDISVYNTIYRAAIRRNCRWYTILDGWCKHHDLFSYGPQESQWSISTTPRPNIGKTNWVTEPELAGPKQRMQLRGRFSVWPLEESVLSFPFPSPKSFLSKSPFLPFLFKSCCYQASGFWWWWWEVQRPRHACAFNLKTSLRA